MLGSGLELEFELLLRLEFELGLRVIELQFELGLGFSVTNRVDPFSARFPNVEFLNAIPYKEGRTNALYRFSHYSLSICPLALIIALINFKLGLGLRLKG